jgi:hypothetical protein
LPAAVTLWPSAVMLSISPKATASALELVEDAPVNEVFLGINFLLIREKFLGFTGKNQYYNIVM